MTKKSSKKVSKKAAPVPKSAASGPSKVSHSSSSSSSSTKKNKNKNKKSSSKSESGPPRDEREGASEDSKGAASENPIDDMFKSKKTEMKKVSEGALLHLMDFLKKFQLSLSLTHAHAHAHPLPLPLPLPRHVTSRIAAADSAADFVSGKPRNHHPHHLLMSILLGRSA